MACLKAHLGFIIAHPGNFPSLTSTGSKNDRLRLSSSMIVTKLPTTSTFKPLPPRSRGPAWREFNNLNVSRFFYFFFALIKKEEGNCVKRAPDVVKKLFHFSKRYFYCQSRKIAKNNFRCFVTGENPSKPKRKKKIKKFFVSLLSLTQTVGWI